MTKKALLYIFVCHESKSAKYLYLNPSVCPFLVNTVYENCVNGIFLIIWYNHLFRPKAKLVRFPWSKVKATLSILFKNSTFYAEIFTRFYTNTPLCSDCMCCLVQCVCWESMFQDAELVCSDIWIWRIVSRQMLVILSLRWSVTTFLISAGGRVNLLQFPWWV